MQNMTCWLQNVFINLLTVYLLTIMPSIYFEMKKALGDMQTLRAGCSKAEPKVLARLQSPFPGVQYGQNLISWRWSLPLPTNPVW